MASPKTLKDMHQVLGKIDSSGFFLNEYFMCSYTFDGHLIDFSDKRECFLLTGSTYIIKKKDTLKLKKKLCTLARLQFI